MTRSDRDHLRILSICHYALGGLCFVFGSIPIIHLVIGIAMVNGAMPQQQQGNGPPFPAEVFGWFFIGIASAVIAFNWSLGLALIQAGTCLRQQRWRTFCMVVAGFACLMQPLGLALGIFTFIVLLRPSVRDAFEPASGESPGRPPDDSPDYDRYHTD